MNLKYDNELLMTVIIPVYNVQKYLRRCVESILSQEKGDLEIVLVDDGSQDQSGELCDLLKQEYDAIIKVIHKKNGGLSSARNAGLNIARGKYVFFLDSDDCIYKDFMKLVRPRLLSDKYDIIEFKCCCEKQYNLYQPICKESEVELTSKDCIENILKNRSGNEICLKIYKRNLFDKIRFPEGRNYEDIATCYQVLMRADTILSIDSEYYIYNFTNMNSITKSVSIKNLTDMYMSVNELCSGVQEFCHKENIDMDYIEYYKRHSYIYILIKLLERDNDCELKKTLMNYLNRHNKYNLFKYRFYDWKRWGFYQVMHLLGRM